LLNYISWCHINFSDYIAFNEMWYFASEWKSCVWKQLWSTSTTSLSTVYRLKPVHLWSTDRNAIFCLYILIDKNFFFSATAPQWATASSFNRFLDHTQQHTTVSRTPLEEWSARRRDLNPTTHNTHNRQTSMPLVGFETTISAGEQPQSYALDRAATGIGHMYICIYERSSHLLWGRSRKSRSETIRMCY